MTREPLRAWLELRLHCRDCNETTLHCPTCGTVYGITPPAGVALPFTPAPHPCFTCGTVLHPRVVGFCANPTGEAEPSDAVQGWARQLERSWAAAAATPPAPAPATPDALPHTSLAEAWRAILQRLELPSTRMLLGQQARLLQLSRGRVYVGVNVGWLPMVRSRIDRLADAIEAWSGRRLAVELQPLSGGTAPAAAATTPPPRRRRRRKPARRPRRPAPAAPPPSYRQPSPPTATRRTIAQWRAHGVALDHLAPATVARGFRQAHGCEPRRQQQTRIYSAAELAAALQQLGQPIPAALQGMEAIK